MILSEKHTPKGRDKMDELTDCRLQHIDKLIAFVVNEHTNQIKKWGVQTHSLFEWLCYATEELGEMAEAIAEYHYREGDPVNIVEEAIQTATLCLKIAEMVMVHVVVKKE